MKKINLPVSLLVICTFLFLSACGSATASPTATPVDVNAISTEAVQTFVAQLTAEAPTITPTPEASNTPEATATLATPLATVVLAVPTAANCANYEFVKDVTIPDGTQMTPNQTFTKTWRVKNNGTCDWTTSFKLAFSYGEAMGGTAVPMPNTVAVGQTVDLSVDLKAPNKTGQLNGVWALFDDKGNPFGKLLTVVIKVGAATPTATGNPTATLEASATTTETPTATTAP